MFIYFKIIIHINKYFAESFLIDCYWGWGLGIGDWAQSPIPNPQSPFFHLIDLFPL